ncbi:MAG: helix-turn-helix transcriptional regulator [Microbacterium sp.]|uniref:helix-turn-helix transcriptional regulator n=1 Tax=Microbacterium sp. TaxID=51671 RepID=UPI003F7F4145
MSRQSELNSIIEQAAVWFAAVVEARADELLRERNSLPEPVASSLLLSPREAAELIGLAPSTLANWRSSERPGAPTYVKLGRLVKYRRADVEDWIAAHS